jgi:calcineurin-like phosphoesterase family protein
MEKFNILILLAVLTFGLMACTNQKSNNNSTVNKDVREKVWEQLKPSQKELIKGTWSDATITKVTLDNSMGKIEDTSYNGKEVYLIDFQTTKMTTPNDMIIFADMENGKIIGYSASE